MAMAMVCEFRKVTETLESKEERDEEMEVG
jgi:hypothetical protein